MEFTIKLTDATTLIAIYGALVATAVFVWDIIKWLKSGPILKVDARPNMQFFQDSEFQGDMYVFVEVTNVGDRPTTLTHLGLIHYKNLLNRLRKKEEMVGIVLYPGVDTLPYLLSPGNRWVGQVKQTNDLEQWAKSDIVQIAIYTSSKEKPTRTRVRFKSGKHQH